MKTPEFKFVPDFDLTSRITAACAQVAASKGMAAFHEDALSETLLRLCQKADPSRGDAAVICLAREIHQRTLLEAAYGSAAQRSGRGGRSTFKIEQMIWRAADEIREGGSRPTALAVYQRLREQGYRDKNVTVSRVQRALREGRPGAAGIDEPMAAVLSTPGSDEFAQADLVDATQRALARTGDPALAARVVAALMEDADPLAVAKRLGIPVEAVITIRAEMAEELSAQLGSAQRIASSHAAEDERWEDAIDTEAAQRRFSRSQLATVVALRRSGVPLTGVAETLSEPYSALYGAWRRMEADARA